MNNFEIDKLVAEKVMGWDVKNLPGIETFAAITKSEILTIGEDFAPSIKFEDALRVAQNFDYHLIERDRGHYYCTVSTNYLRYIDSKGETAPLAICFAALKAFGVEVE